MSRLLCGLALDLVIHPFHFTPVVALRVIPLLMVLTGPSAPSGGVLHCLRPHIGSAGTGSVAMTKIACVTTLKALPGKGDELLRHCQIYAPRFVANEPGTLRIELLKPLNEPDTVVAWDVYESAAAIEAHRNGDLLREFLDKGKSILVTMSGVRHTLVE
jgi:quinol monooxygenase YgiN